ncbi:MAG: T9SS type A sorting domain-containing protein [Gemmatimonadota bacterium]|nr:MAG: T9SS type A sorting domain-containing protein [Gemmatimonadota bacterium]
MMRRIQVLLAAVVVAALVLGICDIGVAQKWSVRDTTSFYFYDFHFFTNYYKTPMTLRGIGEHCYVWTQNSQWDKGRFLEIADLDTVDMTIDTTDISIDTTYVIDTTFVATDVIVNPDSIRIDMEDVHAIIAAFDTTSPAADDTVEGILSSTAGIYEKLTSVYGKPPDVDGDSLIYILLIDCTEAIGAAAMIGYFDPANQLTPVDNEFSNYREVIYIDCYPFDPSVDGLASVAQQFTHLLQYGNDPDEECWIHEGLTYFSQFICGYGLANPNVFSRMPLTFYYQSHLTNLDCREQPEVQDQAKTTMFFQYIFEHYGIEVIQTIATDTRNAGTEAVTAALAANGKGQVDFDSLFIDEQLAWFMDWPQKDFYDGKYSFKYYNSGALLDGKTFTYWGTLDNAPYKYPGNQWSADFITIIPPAPCLGNENRDCYNPNIVFNGGLEHNFRVIAVKTNSMYLMSFAPDPVLYDSLTLEFLTLDDRNRTVFDASGYGRGKDYSTLFLTVIHKEAKDGSNTRTQIVIDNDETDPEPLHIGVLQNPLADRYLDIYVASNESLYVVDNQDQRPELVISVGGEIDTLMDIEKYALILGDGSTWWKNTIIYHVEQVLSGEGTYEILAGGWDIAGNVAPPDEISGSVKIANTSTGAALTSSDGAASLVLPAGAFARQTYVTLFPVASLAPGIVSHAKASFFNGIGMISAKSESGQEVGRAYQFGPAGRRLYREAVLTLKYDEEALSDASESELDIRRLEGSEWVCLGGTVDRVRNTISVEIDRLGQYQIQVGRVSAGAELPMTYALMQNYPNPFNPSTDIRYQISNIRSSVKTTLKVYNILGHEVRTLVDGPKTPGYYTVTWDGRDEEGNEVSSGVYFYRLHTGQFERTKRMVLLK